MDTLVALCSQVGMPREVKTLIMEELEQVVSVENDEVLRKYAGAGRRSMANQMRKTRSKLSWRKTKQPALP